MHFSVRTVPMKPCTKSSYDLAGGPAKSNPIPSSRNVSYRETLRAEPVGSFLDIATAEAESVCVLLWSEPSVVIGRGWVLLVGEKLVELCLLASGWFHHQRCVLDC